MSENANRKYYDPDNITSGPQPKQDLVPAEPAQLPAKQASDKLDAFDDFLNEAPSFGPLLKFNKGAYIFGRGDKVIPLGSTFIADPAGLQRGWVKFQDGAPVEHRLGLVREGHKLEPRQSLGDTDPKKWETDKQTAQPKDPWVQQYFLPMQRMEGEDDEALTFVSQSIGGAQAVRDLVRVWKPFSKTGAMPIIEIQADHYNHPKFGRTAIPIFKVVGWHETGNAPSIAPSNPAPKPAPAAEEPRKVKAGSDMDEDIPF
jgi:hypothetical protein